MPSLEDISRSTGTTAGVHPDNQSMFAIVGPERDGVSSVLLFDQAKARPFWPVGGMQNVGFMLADGRHLFSSNGVWYTRRASDDGAMADWPAPRSKPGPAGAEEAIPAREDEMIDVR